MPALPRHHFDLLAPHLTTVSLQQAEVLAEPGDEFDQVYFPQSGMLSLLAVLRDGKAIETATVGREGVVGASLDVEGSHYFDIHHTASDTLDKVNPRELALCVATMAVMAYTVADMPDSLK